MIENRNQNIDLFKSKSENNIEICLPILYRCWSKHFKKEDYEKINERGTIYSKFVFWKGQILF